MTFAAVQDVARRVAAAASTQLGEMMWLRDYPVDVHGEIGRVVLGVERGALHRVIGVVADLGGVASATIELATPEGPRLRGYHGTGAEREAVLANAIVAEIKTRGDAWPMGLLDAGYGVFDAMTQRLAVAGSGWRLSTWGEWDDRMSGVSVELYGDHDWHDLISIRPAPGGVAITIPGATMGAAEHALAITSPGGLVDALGAILDAVRAAVDGRAAFRARPDGITAFGHQLLDALRTAHALRGTLRLAVSEGAGYPRAWPTAGIDRVDDQGAHRYVTLEESAAGVTIAIDTVHGPYLTFAAAAHDLAAITAEARAARDRLRPDHLVPGRTYRAIAPIRAAGMAIEAGTRLLFVGIDYVPREGYSIYRFTIAGAGSTRLELAEYADADVAILRRLHEVLAVADPA